MTGATKPTAEAAVGEESDDAVGSTPKPANAKPKLATVGSPGAAATAPPRPAANAARPRAVSGAAEAVPTGRPAAGRPVVKDALKEAPRAATVQPAAKAKPAGPAPAKPAGKARVTPVEPAAKPALAPPLQPMSRRRPRKRRRGFALLSFVLLCLVPAVMVGWYYNAVASDQYRSETRFAVRGTDTSAVDILGFSALPGATSQSADAYIVTDYINSAQLLRDLQREQGVDVRTFFASEAIDPLYRIDADMPWEEFLWYWEWMTDADFNSTTQITTFRVNAFSSEEAGAIAAAVLKAAAKLVNELSTEAQTQLIRNAEEEVRRTEDRLTAARQALLKFRDKEQQLDPKLQAESDQSLITGLEKELIELRARRAALLSTVRSNSPSVRVLDRQIQAAQAQLDAQRGQIGTGEGDGTEASRNRAVQLNDYDTLTLEREFAEKAYTSALSSLETSQAEARKQERYFAIVVEPTEPSVPLFPYRIVNTLIGFVAFFVLWLLVYLIAQSVRDHTA